MATEGQQGFLEGDVYDMAIKSTPLGRVGQPEDIGPIAPSAARRNGNFQSGQR
ncbi:hypothetical protein [Nostoc sp.]|uniref:hypothetical protein n=1 Tax=Nostoc sp. TaxID=1180 RepID=UPI002FF78A76